MTYITNIKLRTWHTSQTSSWAHATHDRHQTEDVTSRWKHCRHQTEDMTSRLEHCRHQTKDVTSRWGRGKYKLRTLQTSQTSSWRYDRHHAEYVTDIVLRQTSNWGCDRHQNGGRHRHQIEDVINIIDIKLRKWQASSQGRDRHHIKDVTDIKPRTWLTSSWRHDRHIIEDVTDVELRAWRTSH